MNVNIEELLLLADTEQWSIPKLADNLGVEYSYLHRVIKGKKNGGGKLFKGIYQLCINKNLDVGRFLF
ncbi:hypothetical protein [Paenibacillus sp. HJGM_3]|uniref:hypothetical protein n=1 Tax=Paenibacillus sp. HJGM_3 TaxID=3379816 RepID=UPI00385FD758